MKTTFTFLSFFIGSVLTAQVYNSPESVEYDANHQRYIVANTNGNNLQQVIPGSAPTPFVPYVLSPYGIVIVGDTVYVLCNSTHLIGYSLSTGVLEFDVSIGGTFLNGICTDFAGNIFITDFTAKKVVRYNIATQEFNYFVGTAMAKTPNGIVYDPFHNRLVIATWGTNASILGLSLTDSTISTLKPTTLTNIDGLTIDEDGNFYAADWGSDGIYFFDSAFANAPIKVVSGLSNPADISYNTQSDTLAVPNTGNHTVRFFGFPRPVPVDDFDTAYSYYQTICVLQNDSIGGNTPLMLQSFSSPQLGYATDSGNCINYVATNSGTDTISYVVCSVDTPSFCRTGYLFITNVIDSNNHPPFALDDTATTIQLHPITINVAANDADAITDTLCITSISGSNFFSLDPVNCTNIIFSSDSFFVGSDTCFYVICDNGFPVLCDTASLVVSVDAWLPVADFILDFSNITCHSLTTINTSIDDTGTATWVFSPQFSPSTTLYGDTGYYLNLNMHGFYGEVCLYVSNQFGSDSVCHSYQYICEGVEEISLSNISLFPNPANNILTIDMQNNSDEITRNYSSIEIANAIGEKQKSVSKKGTGKIAMLDVSDLPNGIYLATIISDKRERKMLGKFTISR